MSKIEPELISGMGYVGTSTGVLYRMTPAGKHLTAGGGSTVVINGAKDNAPLDRLTLHGGSTQGSTTGAQLLDINNLTDVSNYPNTAIAENGGLSKRNEDLSSPDRYLINVIPNMQYSFSAVDFVNGAVLQISDLYQKGESESVVDTRIYAQRKQVEFNSGKYEQLTLSFFSSQLNTEFKATHIMLNAGSAALPWEPYTGGAPSPSPSYPQEIESAGMDGEIDVEVLGKNLIPFKEIPTSTKNGITITTKSNGIVHFEGTATKAYDSPVISLQGVSLPKGRYRILEPRNDIKLHVVVKKWTGNNIWEYDIAEIEEGDELLYCYFTITDGASVNADAYVYMQIDNGEILAESDFEPYKPAQKLIIPTPGGLPGIPVSSGGNYTDEKGQQWVCDEIDLAKGERVQWIEEYRFTGAEAWFSWGVNNITEGITGLYWYYGSVIPTNHREILNTHAVFSRNVCGGREEGTMANIDSSGDDYLIWSVRNEYLEDVSSKDAAVQSFKKLLGEINAKMLYCLATPIRTPLPPETIAAYKALQTYSPTTTVINDAGAGMSVRYKGK